MLASVTALTLLAGAFTLGRFAWARSHRCVWPGCHTWTAESGLGRLCHAHRAYTDAQTAREWTPSRHGVDRC